MPKSLCVTLRKTAYSGKKYHSGTMCAGVTRKFALLKLSLWANQSGALKIIPNKSISITMKLKTSFII